MGSENGALLQKWLFCRMIEVNWPAKGGASGWRRSGQSQRVARQLDFYLRLSLNGA